MNILAGYVSSVFQEFECFLRTEVDLVEDDIRLVLDEYNSTFVSYGLQPRIYTFNDLSEALSKILQTEYNEFNNVIVIEFDDTSLKTKLVVRSGNMAISFDEKLFFSTILGFNHGWDYKTYNEYLSQKIVNLSTTNKIHLN